MPRSAESGGRRPCGVSATRVRTCTTGVRTDLEQAVALHGGQAAALASQFRSMSDLERSQVETFLNSLGAPPAPVAPHSAVEAVRHPADQPGADPAPAPGHGAAWRDSMLD